MHLHGLMIPLMLAAMVMARLWRQMLFLLLLLLVAVFCLGLYYVVAFLHG